MFQDVTEKAGKILLPMEQFFFLLEYISSEEGQQNVFGRIASFVSIALICV